MKTKVFASSASAELEEQLNNFLQNVDFIGLEYAVSDRVFSAIVIYKEKL